MSRNQPIVQRTLARIDRGRSGSLLSIPTTIQKFDEIVGGTVQGLMYLVGAETSVGKTAFVRDKCVYTPYEKFKAINNTNLLDILIVDFSLEMPAEVNMASMMSRKLYFDYGRVVPATNILNRLSDDNKRIIDGNLDYFNDFASKVKVFEEEVTPTIYHDVLFEIAKANGRFSQEARWVSQCGTYTPNNPNLYVIIIVDTVNLAETDSGHDTVKSTIDRISRISVYFRNKCKFTPIIIQQFNAEISAVDRHRYGIKTPLLRDFEDSKRPVKDADVVIGLYDPMRHMKDEETMFRGYNIEILKSWFRSAHILKNRYGLNNRFIPLKFDGAVGYFEQLRPAAEMDQDAYLLATKHTFTQT